MDIVIINPDNGGRYRLQYAGFQPHSHVADRPRRFLCSQSPQLQLLQTSVLVIGVVTPSNPVGGSDRFGETGENELV